MPNKARSAEDILIALSTLRARLNQLSSEQDKLALVAQATFSKGTSPDLSKQAEAVLKDVQTHPGTARAEIAKRVDLPPDEVTKIVVGLQEQEKLIRVGTRRTTRWFTPDVLEAIKKSL
jgi:predicted Rossmann fold nucleotide-binding protein DprA/Smf involved in DNA uptake